MKRRLTIFIFLIAAAAVLVSSLVGVYGVRRRELITARQSLEQVLALLDAQGEITDVEGAIRQIDKAAPELRLTFIAPDGTVLGDTDAEDIGDHSDRPEVVLALTEGWGEDVRRSATTGITTVYVARAFSDGVVGRAARPVASVNELVIQSAVGLLAAALLALVLALVLARKLAVSTARPVEEAEVAFRHVDETLQSVRSEFTANVTHELKTPLTSIKGFTDMLASGMVRDPEDQKRFLTMISVEVDRLTKLVDDILKVSELETVGRQGSGEFIELLAAANEAARLLAPVARQAEVELRVAGHPVTAAISWDHFREVAINLMENAIKYNRPGGKVTVTLSEEGGMACFAVADTGIGIPEESQSRVFERFYRVDKGRSRAAGGTGLGLAIVKHITALWGGEIRLTSRVGVGTTVTVALPKK